MAQALYRKWRSQTFDEVVGQEHVMQTLRNALRDNRVAHAYLFCGPRGTGKCVKFDTFVVDPTTGALETIQTLYQRKQATLLTLDSNYKLRATSPADFVDDGIKPCYKVVTALGREIETTLSHPFLTIQGWQRLAELKVGDRIAVPRYLPITGTAELPPHQVKLIAYFLAEGSTSNLRKIGFTSTDSEIVTDFLDAISKFDNARVQMYDLAGQRAPTYWIYQQTLQNHLNKPGQTRIPLIKFAKEFGFHGKTAAEKSIPAIIFQLPLASLRIFLKALFSCDGGVDWTSSTPTVHYCSVSHRFVQQIQHLLLRFGIVARIRYKPTKYKDAYRPAWLLEITNRESIDLYVSEIGFIGAKVEKLHRLAEQWQTRISNPNKDVIPAEVYQLVHTEKIKSGKTWVDVGHALGYKIPKKAGPRFEYSPSRNKLRIYGEVLGSQEVCNLANSDLYWDEIVSIEYSGEHQVYDLTIADTHNFVANDFIVHNTSTARILAKAVNCTAPEAERPCDKCPTCIAITGGRMLDLIEIDAASNNSVDDIRDLRDKVGFRPSEGRYKVYVIDEVHMLSGSAFNALLKTLEEPPPHARFILATTEPHKIPATILSRCQRFDFRRIPVTEIAAHLQHIIEAEQFKAEPEALLAIARSAQGCMRDAISLLDQMLSYGNETISFLQVQQALGAVSAQAVMALVDALATKNVTAGLALIQQLVTEGASLPEFCHQVIEYLRGVMVLQMTGDAALLFELPAETVKQMQVQAKQLSGAATFATIKRFNATIQDLKGGYHPQLPLEMALIESIQGEALLAPTVIVQQVMQPPSPTPVSAPVPTVTPPPPAVGQPPMAVPTEIKPPEQPVVAPEPPPLDSAAIQKLNARWKEFMSNVRTQCGVQVEAALRAVRDIAVGEQAVAFAFGSNEFSRGMVARPETLGKVVTILSGILGRSITLECQIGDQAKLAKMLSMHTSDQQGDGPDPLVAYALSDLGAEVVK